MGQQAEQAVSMRKIRLQYHRAPVRPTDRSRTDFQHLVEKETQLILSIDDKPGRAGTVRAVSPFPR